jgi:hypothetical protein
MGNQIAAHKKSIIGQIGLCQEQYRQTNDAQWIDRQIALEGVLAQIDNTVVLEYGLHKLWELLKLNKTDVINAEINKVLSGEDTTQSNPG